MKPIQFRGALGPKQQLILSLALKRMRSDSESSPKVPPLHGKTQAAKQMMYDERRSHADTVERAHHL